MLRLLKSLGGSAAGSSSDGRADPLRQLAREAARGQLDAQRTLAAAIGPAILHVLRSVLGAHSPDIEDTLQEALFSFNEALPGFRGECSTLHFACRVTLHTAMNARRRAESRKRHTPSMAPEQLEELARDDLSPADLLAAARRREALRQLLLELPRAQAEVLALHTMLGYTIEETAETIGIPRNTVRSRLRHALSALRQRIYADQALFEMIKGEA